ncbi:hypothetical protein M514_20403 [Trichuris suis]|uniref:Uncharacterized protein n=1 Tax=Trichuris suis TaxID=68888 RepID=A0A085ND21_9BILA|nr:hypothetical protein M514_20403 [Trichuris suis]
MLYWRGQCGYVVQNSVELVFTGSQPPPPHQLAQVQRQRASVRAAPLPMRVFCLGPHRLYGLRFATLWSSSLMLRKYYCKLMFNVECGKSGARTVLYGKVTPLGRYYCDGARKF